MKITISLTIDRELWMQFTKRERTGVRSYIVQELIRAYLEKKVKV